MRHGATSLTCLAAITIAAAVHADTRAPRIVLDHDTPVTVDLDAGRALLRERARTAAVRRSGPPARLCGDDTAAPVEPLAVGGPPAPPRFDVLRLAVETDYELYELFGDVDATAAYVLETCARVSELTQRDLGVRIEVVFVRIWDDPADLFNEPDPLAPFRDWWEANMTDVERDDAVLLSGRRDLPYGGMAYIEGVCTSQGYFVVGYLRGLLPETTEADVDHFDVPLVAHELGHSLGALHTHAYGIDACDDLWGAPQRGTIMSYCSQSYSGANADWDLYYHRRVRSAIAASLVASDCLRTDCNDNGIDDADEIALGAADDLDGNGIIDDCDDCNGNGVPDGFDIGGGTSSDLDGNGIPDECDPDCNGNGVPDARDISSMTSSDAYGDGVPDECGDDLDGNGVDDYTDIQLDMTLDIDRDARLDAFQDCDGDGTTDLDALDGAGAAWIGSAVPGDPLRRFHPRTGVLDRIGPAFPGGVHDVRVGPDDTVYASSPGENAVRRLDRDGTDLGLFVAAGGGGLVEPAGLLFTDDGDLLVASRGTDEVLRFAGTDGAPLGAFVAAGSGGLVAPFGLARGPGGDLLVTSDDGRVLRYDAAGAFVGAFVTAADAGGLLEPRGLDYGADGPLLVASFGTDQVLAYDRDTGAFLGQFQHAGTDTVLTLDGPWGVRRGPDGLVHVSRHEVTNDGGGGGHDDDGDDHHGWMFDLGALHVNSTRVYAFDAATGRFERSYVTGHDTGLFLPTGFDFLADPGTDCNGNGRADACDIADGTSADADGDGVPDECGCPGDVDGDGTTAVGDLVAVILAWGPCPAPCPADLDGSGAVDVADLVAVILAWGGCG